MRPLRKPCDSWLNRNIPATPFKFELATEQCWTWPPASGTDSVGVWGLHSPAPLSSFPPLLPNEVPGQSRGWTSLLELTNYLAKCRDNILCKFPHIVLPSSKCSPMVYSRDKWREKGGELGSPPPHVPVIPTITLQPLKMNVTLSYLLILLLSGKRWN